jgi:Spy/CpxP family protein refolding chaperone
MAASPGFCPINHKETGGNAMTATVKHVVLGTAAVLVALGAGAGVFVHAQDQNTNPPARPFMGRGGPGGRFGGPGGPMGMLPMLGRELNLTDAQRDQIKAIAQTHASEWQALAERERTVHAALNAVVTADTIDEAAIRQKSSEVAAVDADMAVARAHARAEVMQILTADQKAQLKAMQTRKPRQQQGL